MKKISVWKANSCMRKSISAGMLWLVYAVRMVVLLYGYGIEYNSVAGIKLKGMRDSGCEHGCGCENPEQNLRLLKTIPTQPIASFERENHNFDTATTTATKHRNHNYRKFYAQESKPKLCMERVMH